MALENQTSGSQTCIFCIKGGMRDGCNCQLFVEMHNFLIIKTLSVLIPASGLCLGWGSSRMVLQGFMVCQAFFWQGFVSTHNHQLHLAVQERWEKNQVGALMVYLDKNI